MLDGRKKIVFILNYWTSLRRWSYKWEFVRTSDFLFSASLKEQLERRMRGGVRGPSGKARFLAKFGHVGCAGSTGVAYDAREWNPGRFGGLARIIKQSGAFGLEDKVPGFPQIGELKTDGVRVTLLYCWFSPIDTWDNPILCPVDNLRPYRRQRQVHIAGL